MSSDAASPGKAYPDGFAGILEQMEARRAPLSFAPGEALPPLDTDLAALRDTLTPPPGDAPVHKSGNARKSFDIARELQGQSALLHLTALLVAHLRKRGQPQHAAPLFLRIWKEQGDFLIRNMDLRWKVSCLTTFGDHGENPAQRATGQALSTLFNTMKLYESERLYSGFPPTRAFTLDNRAPGPLPLGMNAYALADGGLDVNLLGRLWQDAGQDAVIAPLARDMLTRLIEDPATVLHRLHILRTRKARRDAMPARPYTTIPIPSALTRGRKTHPRWGIVTTTNAPLRDIARFVAHHLDRGAHAITLFLDTPDPEVTAFLARDARVTTIPCGPDYWRALGKKRMQTHQLRQAFNATRALHLGRGSLDFLLHIDVDEFLLGDADIGDCLRDIPADMAGLRLRPAEALVPDGPGTPPRHFKRAPRKPTSAMMAELYPTFGAYLRTGLLSHVAGKVIVRTGLENVRFGLHTLRHDRQDVRNIAPAEGLWLGHLHVQSWQHFRNRLDFRLTRGAYRPAPGDPAKSVGGLLTYLRDEEGEDGLRLFYDEVCRDGAGLRQRLATHGLLLETAFDPDAALSRMFGNLPDG